MRSKEKKDLSDTLKRSKTHKYEWQGHNCDRLYAYSTRPNLHNSRAVKKERGEVITLLGIHTLRELYKDLPNGRYYEYYIQTACLQGKQVKSISYYYAHGESAVIGVDLLEDLEGRFIAYNNTCFDVKGGVATEVMKQKAKPSRSKIKGKQGASRAKIKSTLSTPSSIKNANNKIMKFYAKKLHEGKISKKLYAKCIAVRQRCDLESSHFPFRLKDRLCDVYALYEESHPLPPSRVQVERAEEKAINFAHRWVEYGNEPLIAE